MTERRSKLWLTVAAIPAFALLLALGFWQLDRLEWKEALLARIDAGLSAPATPLPAEITSPESWDYRRVTVTGRFDHDRELHLHRRSVEGQGGYQILTPLIRAEGPPVLVNRGWVPPALKEAAARPQGQVMGTVTIEGVARLSGRSGFFTPESRPDQKLWFFVDLPAMAKAVDLPLAPVIVDAGDAPNPGGFPLGGQTQVNIPNNHLQYVVTWFGLALALAVIYVVYVFRRR